MFTRHLERLKASLYWRDIAWLTSGNVVAQLITVTLMPILSRMYSPADYATLSLFGTGVGFAGLVVSFRFEYLVQLPADDQKGWDICRFVARISLLVTLVLTPLAFLFAMPLAKWAGGGPSLSRWIPLIPLTASLTAVAVVAQGWIQRRSNFRRSGESEALDRTLRYAFPLGMGLAGANEAWLIIGGPVGLVGKILYCLRHEVFNLFGRLRGFEQLFTRYARIAGSMCISHLMLAGTNAIPILYLTKQHGSASLGQYSLALTVVSLPTALIGSAIGSAFYQRAAEQWARGFEFRDLWWSTARRLLMVGLPAYAAAVIFLPIIVPVVFGNQWHQAGMFSSMLAVSAFFTLITGPMDRACLIVGAWWYVVTWHGFRLITTAFVVWFGLKHGWKVDVFLVWLVVQQSLMYLIDYWANWRFAGSKPKLGAITERVSDARKA